MTTIREPQTHPARPVPLTLSPSANTNVPVTLSEIPLNVLACAFTTRIIQIFGSARYPYPSVRSLWQVTLPIYISSILYASRLPIEVGMTAMVLVFRYKEAMPHSVAYGDDAPRLFLAAYMVAAKIISDADLEPQDGGASSQLGLEFWFRISQKRFPIEELHRMELQLCRILRWDLQVSREDFISFRRVVYQECEVGTDVLEAAEEGEEMEEEERLRQEQHVERPPPPYSEVERDVRVVEIPVVGGTVAGQGGHTGARGGSWQGEISPMAQSPAQALIPSVYGMSPEDDEERQSFGRLFEEMTLPPMTINREREENRRGDLEVKEKGLMAVVKERIFQIVMRKPSLPTCI